MKEFIENIIPRLKSLSIKLDKETILKKVHWVMIDEDGKSDTTYIFRENNELLVSKNGDVSIGIWEYLTFDKLLIRIDDRSFLYKQEYFDDKILALKKDGSEYYSVFLNEDFLNQESNALGKVEAYYEKKLLENKKQDEIIIQNEINVANDELSWSTVIGIIFLLVLIFIILIILG